MHLKGEIYAIISQCRYYKCKWFIILRIWMTAERKDMIACDRWFLGLGSGALCGTFTIILLFSC